MVATSSARPRRRLLLLPVLLPLAWSCATLDVRRGETGGVAYDDRGEGFPVLLLSATGLDRRMWDEQAGRLARSHRVIRLDPRGFGASRVPLEPYDSREDLAHVLSDLDVGRACVVGQSGAAALAVDFALQFPNLVAGLVLVAPGLSGYPFPPEEITRFERLEQVSRREGHAAAVALLMRDPYLEVVSERPRLARRVRRILSESANMWHPDLVRFARPVAEPAAGRLEEIAVPTLVVLGDRDLAHIGDIARRLEAGISGARLEIIPGAGHLLPIERPREIERLLEQFAIQHCHH